VLRQAPGFAKATPDKQDERVGLRLLAEQRRFGRIVERTMCVIANSEKSGIIKTGFQEGEK
jgi:hypothetical protein